MAERWPSKPDVAGSTPVSHSTSSCEGRTIGSPPPSQGGCCGFKSRSSLQHLRRAVRIGKELVLKTGEGLKALGGSNPSLSAIFALTSSDKFFRVEERSRLPPSFSTTHQSRRAMAELVYWISYGRGICGCAVDSKSTEVGPTPADRAISPWGYSSVGRAPALQAGCRESESRYFHHIGSIAQLV